MKPTIEWREVWKRLSDGRHVVLEGAAALPPAGPELRLVVLECDTNPGPRGTLEEARRRLESALMPPVPPPMIDRAPSYLRAELRKILLGEPSERLDLEHYFRSFIAAPRIRGAVVVLVLRGVERADIESLGLLERLVRDGGLALPLLWSFERPERSPAAQRLYDALSRTLPVEAFWRVKESPSAAAAAEPPSSDELLSLPAATLRVLLAAATLGDRFETEVLAELLEVSETAVLETLHDSVDRGLAIEDRGQGVFRLEKRLAGVLREMAPPSLARSWHEQLAQMFGGPPAPAAAPRVNEPRAAMHAEAAGSWIIACDRHVAAASIASRTGAHEAAFGHVADARRLAARVADRELQRRVEIASHLVSGRAAWQSHSSLDAAETDLRAARALTSDRDPPELRAEIAMLLAGVHYDFGTREALEQALQEVGLASRLLMDEGRPLNAARILNEEAAIWIKLGDPMRANHLLARSREVFAKLAAVYPVARLELAETEHLLARLLLHAQPKAGHERDVLELAVARGRAAEEAYRSLGDAWQLGRVWETLARLELRRDHIDTAARLLDDAQRLQREVGDALGLARSTAAASDVLATTHDYPKALELLAESIELNSLKRLRAGLEFNLASLRRLEAQLPLELLDTARQLARRLGDALGGGAPAPAH